MAVSYCFSNKEELCKKYPANMPANLYVCVLYGEQTFFAWKLLVCMLSGFSEVNIAKQKSIPQSAIACVDPDRRNSVTFVAYENHKINMI